MEWFVETSWLLPNWAWVAIAAAVVVIIVLLIIFLTKSSKKKKKNKKEKEDFTTELGEKEYESFEGLYFNEKGEKVIVSGPNLWLIDVHGKTELIKSNDSETPNSEGEKIYFVNSETISKVVKVGDDYQKTETKQSNYLTVFFVNKARLSIGDTIYSR